MTPASFNAWIKPCFIKSITSIDSERVIVELATPTTFHSRTVDEKYYAQIKKTLEKVTQKKCELALIIDAMKQEGTPQSSFSSRRIDSLSEIAPVKTGLFSAPEDGKTAGNNLNQKYLFDSYVVGSSNRLAFAAGKAVVENPGTRHNPLFIYGGVGVGKTHLMHAIGHELVMRGVGKIVYVTSEQFTNDLVSSLRSKMTEAFKKKYRQVGALLIDDVQFFAGKEMTQEEFFHTFNELTMNQKQIIMTSDRKPQEIQGLEDRLVSRFLGGMTVDIGLPDYEMRVAILRQKSQEMGAVADEEVYDLLANSMQTNTRELEGNFVKLAMMASIDGGVLTKELVQQTLALPMKDVKSPKVRPIKIISTVAKYFDYKNKELLGSSRKADLVEARHIAMYLLRDTLGLQFAKVGEIMGGRDHTTVMHAVEKMESEIKEKTELRRKVMAVKQSLFVQ